MTHPARACPASTTDCVRGRFLSLVRRCRRSATRPRAPPPDQGRSPCCRRSLRRHETRFLHRADCAGARTSGLFFVRMLEHTRDRANHPFPLARFGGELLSACARELVKACAPIEPGNTPRRLDETLPFQPLQRRIERAMVDEQILSGRALNRHRDAVAVTRAEYQ